MRGKLAFCERAGLRRYSRQADEVAAAKRAKHHADVSTQTKFDKYVHGTSTTSARGEFQFDLSDSLARLGAILNQERYLDLFAKAGTFADAGNQKRVNAICTSVLEGIDTEIPPAGAPGHHLITCLMQSVRCFVCERVALQLLPKSTTQDERRRHVMYTNQFCFGCAANAHHKVYHMCRFCHEINWNHAYNELMPIDCLKIAPKTMPTRPDKSPSASAAASHATTTPERKRAPQRSHYNETQSAKKRRTDAAAAAASSAGSPAVEAQRRSALHSANTRRGHAAAKCSSDVDDDGDGQEWTADEEDT